MGEFKGEKFKAFDRSKTHANTGTVGHVNHGETSLTEAIAKLLYNRVRVDTEIIDDGNEVNRKDK